MITTYLMDKEFYHYTSGYWLYDDKLKELTYIRDYRNVFVGIWFWNTNTLIVFKQGTENNLKRLSTMLCFRGVKRVIFDEDFNYTFTEKDDFNGE